MKNNQKRDNKIKRGIGFNPFDMNRNGKGVDIVEDRTPNLRFFFKQFIRKFPKLLSLDLMMLIMIVPILAAVLIYMWGPTTPIYTHVESAPLLGISILEGVTEGATDISPALNILLSTRILTSSLPMVTPLNMILITLCGLFLFVTWGWQNVGATYITRGLVRGDDVFIISDYFYAIKRNFKQGLLFGMIDFAVIAVLVIDYFFFNRQAGASNQANFMFFLVLALAVIYFIMRFYTYLILVTFDIKISRILKNSLILTVMGIKRNILAFLGIIIMLLFFLGLFNISMPVGISLALVLFFACSEFMKTYAAYPIIEKYMVKK